MTKETRIQPQAKLIWSFLAWNFGWTWSFWLLDIILQRLWPDNPPVPYLALEAILNALAMLGPMIASLKVLKIKGFKSIWSFIFSGRRGTWLYLLIFGGILTATYALAAGGRMIDGGWLAFLGILLYTSAISGGIEEPGWRGFLQPALEQRFSFPVASVMTGVIWSIWHIPLWFYGRFYDRSQDPFLIYMVFTIITAIWLAALYKKTRSVLACIIYHGLYNTLAIVFVDTAKVDSLDFSQINPVFYFAGLIILTGYSIYVWYRADREEKTSDD